MFIVLEVPGNRLSILRALALTVSGVSEVARATTFADLMNAIETEEIKRCRVKHGEAKIAASAMMSLGLDDDPDDRDDGDTDDDATPIVLGGSD